MSHKITLTYYSDVLCVWAYISQVRLDEIAKQHADTVNIDYRFCSVFGDSATKINTMWSNRGGYEGFRSHLFEAMSHFDHVKLHPGIWQQTRPVSSTPAHLVLKAVQRLGTHQCFEVMHKLRLAFFERCEDISHWSVLMSILEQNGVSVSAVQDVINSGLAHADLDADTREKEKFMVQGSPTFILNEGRQKLYGNLGYGVIEANIKELLHSPMVGAASWC